MQHAAARSVPWRSGQPNTVCAKRCVSRLSGAEPEIMTATRPPMRACTFLNTSAFHSGGAPMRPASNSRYPASSAAANSFCARGEPAATFACTVARTRSSTVGANTMNVGRSVGASPRQPGASLSPLSVSVCGLP